VNKRIVYFENLYTTWTLQISHTVTISVFYFATRIHKYMIRVVFINVCRSHTLIIPFLLSCPGTTVTGQSWYVDLRLEVKTSWSTFCLGFVDRPRSLCCNY